MTGIAWQGIRDNDRENGIQMLVAAYETCRNRRHSVWMQWVNEPNRISHLENNLGAKLGVGPSNESHSIPVGISRYRGRFAPSPTGPLHFGSVVAALASCLVARRAGGEWWLRIEDVDEPRCKAEWAESQLRTLERLGFAWDGPVWWQSRRQEAYQAALAQLQQTGAAFPCACSRKALMAGGLLAVDGSPRYGGQCRAGLAPGQVARAWRFRVDGGEWAFDDRIRGHQAQQLDRDVGDFVLLRADGYFAYQLAVVVDDGAQGMTDVVRGADLLDSTPRQMALQRALGLPTPTYAHLPVAVNGAGEKLSKQTLALAMDALPPARVLVQALQFLGQPVPGELAQAGVAEVWAWALCHWDEAKIPRQPRLPAPPLAL